MPNKSAINYYFKSISTIINNFNWWNFPSLSVKSPLLIKIKSGLKFYVSNLMDIWTLKEVVVDDQYEILNKLSAKETVVDVGAAIGDFTIYAAKKVKRVVAYECDDDRVQLMKKNLLLNRVTNVVLRHSKAVSLKQIMKNIDTCDFLKIDCEGGEYAIFNNADRYDLDKIRYIAMEAHKFNSGMEHDYKKLLSTLKNNNFDVKIVPNAVHDKICFVFAKRIKKWESK